MPYVMILLAGALFCNCVPHLSCGLTGVPFPTPFAKPRGVGNSPALTNFLWGTFNLFLAIFITVQQFTAIETVPGLIALAVGFLVAGVYLSRHFGKVRNAV
jgi:hypothetical protein